MANHSSAPAHEETPHITETNSKTIISDALRRRAQSVINDRSIDGHSRAFIRYALEIRDPCLAELVRRADAGERTDTLGFAEALERNDNELSAKKIEPLAEIICRAGDDAETRSAALFVLMGILENSRHPQLLANSAKHFAFSRCGELNLYGMVDAQLALVEGELFSREIE